MLPSSYICVRLAFTIFIAASAVGCTPEAHNYIRFPNLWHPGPAAYQRAGAIQHDPYPLNDVGPVVEGGRPREYQQPVNEVDRAKMAAPRSIMQPVPMPMLPGAPPPVITTPPVIMTPQAPPPLPPASPYQIQPRSPY